MNALIPIKQGEHWDEPIDLGLILNKEEGHTFWRKGDFLQGRGVINGVEIYVSICTRQIGRQAVCAMQVNGQKYPFLSRTEMMGIINSIRNCNGDFIDAECTD